MSANAAIYEAVQDVCRKVGRHSLDVKEMKNLMEFVERSVPSQEFSNRVKETLMPLSQDIQSRDVHAIQAKVKDFPLLELSGRVEDDQKNAIWTSLGMILMLVNTLALIPPEMMASVEKMTSNLMSAMTSSSTGDTSLKNMFADFMGGNASDDDDEAPRKLPQKKIKDKKLPKNKQEEFRAKLC